MSHGGKLTPNLDEKSTKVLNLTVLQRIDPSVEEILITAAHVAFYEFNIDTNQWSRKDVEGSLFVVKRNTQPRFQFIVMNRRNTDNLVENILGDFEYEVHIPYLLYRNASQEVNGIWFYNARECEEVANLFGRILNAYSKVPTKSKVCSTKSEFEELEAVPTSAVKDGPLEPLSSAAANVTDVPDNPAFVNFFGTEMKIAGATKLAKSEQPYQSSATVIATCCPQTMVMPTLSTSQIPSKVSASTPIMSILDSTERDTAAKSTDLVKPSSFFGPTPSSSPLIIPPISSSMPTAPPLNTRGSLQRPYGAPLLQPFPPPSPPPSLTPNAVPSPSCVPAISREKVREALQMLVKDNRFIDMVYQAVVNAHQS